MRFATSLLALGALALGASQQVLAQSAPGTVLLDSTATCPQETRDSITLCLGKIEEDEAARQGGPCTSTDWQCICNKQHGLIACYSPCPGIQPADDIAYQNANCAGQNGVRNGAGGGPATYSGSPITTTAPGGATGTPGNGVAGPSSTPGTSRGPTDDISNGSTTAPVGSTTATAPVGSTTATAPVTTPTGSSSTSSRVASPTVSATTPNAAASLGMSGSIISGALVLVGAAMVGAAIL